MPTNAIIKTLRIFKDGLLGLGSASKAMSVNTFALEHTEEALHRSVIMTVPSATHADHNVQLR